MASIVIDVARIYARGDTLLLSEMLTTILVVVLFTR